MKKGPQEADLALVMEHVELLPLPALVVSRDGEPLRWNARFERLMGLGETGGSRRPAGFKQVVDAVVRMRPSEEKPHELEMPTPDGVLNLWAWGKDLQCGASGDVRLVIFADASRMMAEHSQLLVYAEEFRSLYQTVRQQFDQLNELHKASELLQQSLDLDEIGTLALRQVSAHYDSPAALALLLPDHRQIHVFLIVEPDGRVECAVGAVTPAQMSGLRRSLRIGGKAKGVLERWLPSLVSVPDRDSLDSLKVATTFQMTQKRVGLVCLPERVFSQAEPQYLRAYVDQLSLAIQNALLYEDLRRKATETEILLESARHLSSSLNVNKVLQDLSELTAKHILSNEGAVAIALPSDSRDVVLAGTIRHRDGTVTALSSSQLKNDGAGSDSGAIGRLQDLSDVQRLMSDSLFGGESPQMWREYVVAGAQKGELMVLAPQGEPLDPAKKKLLKAIANHAKVALNHAILFSRERAHAISLSQQHDRRVEYLQQMAHELKTPLTTIRPLLEILTSISPAQDPDRTTEILAIMTRGVSRLEDLTDRYLQGFDVPGLPERLLSFEITDIAALIYDLVKLEQTSLNNRAQQVSFCCQAKQTLALVDRLAVEEVLTNLLSNCRRHAGPDAEVVVTLSEKRGNWLDVTVADNGRGIPSGRLRHLRRIMQNNGADNLGPKDLGLRICAHLIELHGGRTRVRSHPANGTVVGFSLPAG